MSSCESFIPISQCCFSITSFHCRSFSNAELYGWWWLEPHREMQQSTEYENNYQDVSRVIYRSLDMHTELSGGRLNTHMSSYQYGNPKLKVRCSRDRFIINMGIPIRGKDCLYIETGPCYPWDYCDMLWNQCVCSVGLAWLPDHIGNLLTDHLQYGFLASKLHWEFVRRV